MNRPQDERAAEVTLSEERLQVGTEREQVGSARAVKHVDVEQATARVERGTEHADLERSVVDDVDADSGEVETLPDGSISIPVFEEQLVITKRLVVRERVIIRKHTVYEEQVVSADLRRERLEVEAVGDADVEDPAVDRYAGIRQGSRGADRDA
ncbi:MAG: YsnF/AvaK domain-containing protein [Actinomycetota bacterium]|nr:YsnF/AvaK domain-containing protein [Actinomycetota bacterium]